MSLQQRHEALLASLLGDLYADLDADMGEDSDRARLARCFANPCYDQDRETIIDALLGDEAAAHVTRENDPTPGMLTSLHITWQDRDVAPHVARVTLPMVSRDPAPLPGEVNSEYQNT